MTLPLFQWDIGSRKQSHKMGCVMNLEATHTRVKTAVLQRLPFHGHDSCEFGERSQRRQVPTTNAAARRMISFQKSSHLVSCFLFCQSLFSVCSMKQIHLRVDLFHSGERLVFNSNLLVLNTLYLADGSSQKKILHILFFKISATWDFR